MITILLRFLDPILAIYLVRRGPPPDWREAPLFLGTPDLRIRYVDIISSIASL